MEKEKIINELISKLEIEREKANLVVDLLEDYSLIGRNNKKKVKNVFKEQLNMNEEEADKTYNVCCEIIAKEIKNKILHPFRKEN